LKLGTAKNSALNAHLLIDPESEDHVAEAKRFLQSLTFSDGSEKFQCSKTDLIRLGRYHDKSITDDKALLEIGTRQFKVDFNNLIKEIHENKWAKANILIAVASGSDGTSGLSGDDSFA